MKGRVSFAPAEIAELRRLTKEKQVADSARQKSLRQRMRALGFYITDFVADQKGFTVSDLDDLIARGVIRVKEHAEEAHPSQAKRASKRRSAPGDAPHSSEEQRKEARARRARAAQQFKPDRVDLLLVAEAPPSALDRYFYFLDVLEQDSLFRYVCRAVLGREPTRGGKADLLAELRDRGVFLIDLQEDPRDGTPLAEFVPALVERSRALDPRSIVLIKTTVFDAAHDALQQAGLPVSGARVPFPGSGRQKEFLAAFARAVEERQLRGCTGASTAR